MFKREVRFLLISPKILGKYPCMEAVSTSLKCITSYLHFLFLQYDKLLGETTTSIGRHRK